MMLGSYGRKWIRCTRPDCTDDLVFAELLSRAPNLCPDGAVWIETVRGARIGIFDLLHLNDALSRSVRDYVIRLLQAGERLVLPRDTVPREVILKNDFGLWSEVRPA